MDRRIDELYSAYNDTRARCAEYARRNRELEMAVSRLDNELHECVRRCDLEKQYLLAEDDRKNKIINELSTSKLAKIAVRKALSRHQPVKKPKELAMHGNSNPSGIRNGRYYEEDIDFSKSKTDIKPIAFYLPQYHTFPENDKWWGKGFTEWTNVKKAKPLFPGHDQPRMPHKDFGYYTLDNKAIFKKQISLAKEHGIYGFAFYYYWFSGKRLMEKPLNIWLKNKELNFPFCICWANENWTRRWDGRNNDVLIEQKYSEKDPEKFIIDCKEILLDKRYIRVDKKPLLMVYEPNSIPNFPNVVERWRLAAKKCGIGEIEVLARSSTIDIDIKTESCVDGLFDFAPRHLPLANETPACCMGKPGYFYDYRGLIEYSERDSLYDTHISKKPFYYSVTMAWDNSARKAKDYAIFYNYSPKLFHKWLKMVIEKTRKTLPEDRRFIFINAWNEWGEGTYLEPDKAHGYANINTLSRAIFDKED